MGFAMTDTLPKLLLRLSEAGAPATLSGREARRFYGPAFDRLLARRVLVEQEPLRMWSPCSTCECDIGGRPIQTVFGRLVAACPLDAAKDVVLNGEDVRAFETGRASIVQEIARASGLAEPPMQLLPDVCQVTTLPSGEAVIMIQNETVACDPLLVAALRARVRGSRGVILLPSGISSELALQLSDAGFRVIATSNLLKPDWSIDFSSINDDAASDTRLVISCSTKSVEMDGTAISLPDQPFRTLVLLAEAARAGGGSVDKLQIEKRLWRGLRMPDSREVRDIVRDLREALRVADRKVDLSKLVDTKRNPTRYRLLLEAKDVSLLP